VEHVGRAAFTIHKIQIAMPDIKESTDGGSIDIRLRNLGLRDFYGVSSLRFAIKPPRISADGFPPTAETSCIRLNGIVGKFINARKTIYRRQFRNILLLVVPRRNNTSDTRDKLAANGHEARKTSRERIAPDLVMQIFIFSVSSRLAVKFLLAVPRLVVLVCAFNLLDMPEGNKIFQDRIRRSIGFLQLQKSSAIRRTEISSRCSCHRYSALREQFPVIHPIRNLDGNRTSCIAAA